MPAENQLGPAVVLGFVDKRKIGKAGSDGFTRMLNRYIMATANAGGTTTTLVCANATPGTDTATTNVVRIGDEFRLYTSGGALKEETVFTVTAVAVAASTTITFTPAAAATTANGDIARLVGLDSIEDNESLDAALTKLSSTTYTAAVLRQMNQNDKVFAIRHLTDPTQAAGQL
jgi:hypothetical protein